jgi:hypothetical protein
MARLLAAALFLLALGAVPAQARDHDKLPDRWERKHHLNVKKNDAKRDRDHDGLSNYREYRAHTNPRKKDSDRDGLRDGAERRFGFNPRDRDSDNDGIKDGRENAGKIKQVSGSAITIRLAAGGKLTARLGDTLAVACAPANGSDQPSGDAPDASDPAEDAGDPAEDSGDDPSEDGDDPDADDESDDSPDADAAQDDDSADDPAEDNFDADAFNFEAEFAAGEQDCGTSSLKRGALVHEATVNRTGSGPVVVAVALVRR